MAVSEGPKILVAEKGVLASRSWMVHHSADGVHVAAEAARVFDVGDEDVTHVRWSADGSRLYATAGGSVAALSAATTDVMINIRTRS